MKLHIIQHTEYGMDTTIQYISSKLSYAEVIALFEVAWLAALFTGQHPELN